MWAVVYFSLVLMLGFNFTEHMLFYTSEKYPVEDSYSKYIAEVCLIFASSKIFLSFSCFVYVNNSYIPVKVRTCSIVFVTRSSSHYRARISK